METKQINLGELLGTANREHEAKILKESREKINRALKGIGPTASSEAVMEALTSNYGRGN